MRKNSNCVGTDFYNQLPNTMLYFARMYGVPYDALYRVVTQSGVETLRKMIKIAEDDWVDELAQVALKEAATNSTSIIPRAIFRILSVEASAERVENEFGSYDWEYSCPDTPMFHAAAKACGWRCATEEDVHRSSSPIDCSLCIISKGGVGRFLFLNGEFFHENDPKHPVYKLVCLPIVET